MAQSAAEARQEVENARRGVEKELDSLGTATRAAIDIPAKVRRNPVRTVGLATGAAFLFLGGPKRVAKAAEARFFPRRVEKRDRALPKDVQATLARLEPEDREKVEAHLERDFAAYLNREHPKEPANARQSVWKTYDLLLGVVGLAAAREMAKKLFEIPKEVRVEEIQEETEALAEADTKIAQAERKTAAAKRGTA
ncbi:MAG: hypothetical protein WD830_12035 [Chloroflexota bacterium]